MFRTTDIVLIAVMVSAAAFTYKTKHEAENRLDTIRKIQAQIRYEEDTIDLLNADWSLLTQPARLQKLTETFQEDLKLQVTQPQQIVGFGDIPEKPVELPEVSDEKVVSNGRQTKDKVVTGSIAR
ncbi:cell division protein FtsL [Oryzicola mucosus]|uniref:Uncharacterized protein n=1 Tax=Oryzicola mucosus TaxID=2767425 RepID=A0A8J6U4N6_9HYPH|nr:hypothetical protein [Oryzicola mucosus]